MAIQAIVLLLTFPDAIAYYGGPNVGAIPGLRNTFERSIWIERLARCCIVTAKFDGGHVGDDSYGDRGGVDWVWGADRTD